MRSRRNWKTIAGAVQNKMTPNFVASAFFMVCAGVMAVNTLEYSDLDKLAVMSCPSINSCSKGGSKFHERVCECDSLCAFYNDCCIDADRGQLEGAAEQKCVHFGTIVHGSAYVVADCPSTYPGPEEVRDRCRNRYLGDRNLSVPVTDTTNRITYLNSYCAACHEAPFASLTKWRIIECKPTEGYDYSLHNLIYNDEKNTWGRILEGEFRPCDFLFDTGYDRSVEDSLRHCRANLVSSCPSNFTDAGIRRACESYISVVVGAGTTYRNPHCGWCNGIPITDIECFDRYNPPRRPRKAPIFFPHTFYRKERNETSPTKVNCAQGRVYDPFFKKCRALVCALPGYTLVNDKCVRQK